MYGIVYRKKDLPKSHTQLVFATGNENQITTKRKIKTTKKLKKELNLFMQITFLFGNLIFSVDSKHFPLPIVQ